MSWIEEARRQLTEDVRGQDLALPKSSIAHPAGPGNVARWAESEYATSVELISGDSFGMEAIPWLWKGWLPQGRLTLLAGRPGCGKTTIALAFGATVTVGGRWPDGTTTPSGNVCIWSGEDDPRDTLAPRLAAAGANLSRVLFVGNTRAAGEDRSFDPGRDTKPLMRALSERGGCALLIVDPLVSAVAGDSHKNAEVRRGLQPLVDLARSLDCALLGITHLSKGTDGRDPTERVTGSLAFGALARTVLIAAKRQEDDGSVTRLLLRAKSNLGPDDGGFEYDIESSPVPGVEELSASQVLWGKAIDGDARELLAEAESAADPEGYGADAELFLSELLRDGPVATKQIKTDAGGAGIAWRTVERAKKRLGVVAEKQGMKGGWVWRLPEPWECNEDRQKTAKAHTLKSVGLREKVADFEADDKEDRI
jgi:hypothetical protein